MSCYVCLEMEDGLYIQIMVLEPHFVEHNVWDSPKVSSIRRFIATKLDYWMNSNEITSAQWLKYRCFFIFLEVLCVLRGLCVRICEKYMAAKFLKRGVKGMVKS